MNIKVYISSDAYLLRNVSRYKTEDKESNTREEAKAPIIEKDVG